MSPRTPQQFKLMREEKMTLIMDVALEHLPTKVISGQPSAILPGMQDLQRIDV